MRNGTTNGFRRQICRLPALLAIATVRVYQFAISPWLGNRCRFSPSCSQYMIDAIRRYGLLVGAWRGVRRILRCHPWHPGGWDPA